MASAPLAPTPNYNNGAFLGVRTRRPRASRDSHGKRAKDNRKVTQALNHLQAACKNGQNVMPYVIEAVKDYATEQEICDVYREVFWEYRDPGFY